MKRVSRASLLSGLLLACAACAILASTPASAQIQSQPCLTVLDSCQVCFQRNGQIDIRSCGALQPPLDEEGIPAELLEQPKTDELDGLQKEIAERILSHWDVLHAVFGDPNRIYLPREAYGLASQYPGAMADEILRAAVIRFQTSLIAKSSRTRVDRIPTGDGGNEYVIRTTDPLLAFVIRLLKDAGAFADVELAAFIAPSKLGIAPEALQPEADPLFEIFERSLRLNQVALRSSRLEAAIAHARR